MRALVTGASGFIGGALVERLVARGDRVRALVRPTSRTAALSRSGVELVVGSLSDPGALSAAVDGCDAVFHVAGLVKARASRELFAVNAAGTRAVAHACASAKRPALLVYVSSLAAAGPSAPSLPRDEEAPPAPVSDYGRSKLAGEAAVREVARRAPASIVRPPIVYGPGDRELLPPLVTMARAGVLLRAGSAEKRYSVVHVADLCDGILAVADRGARVEASGPQGVYFLESGQECGWDDLGRAVADAMGRRVRVLPLPEASAWAVAAGATLRAAVTGGAAMLSFDKLREAREAYWTCTAARARRQVGFAPRFTLGDGMRDAVGWYLGARRA